MSTTTKNKKQNLQAPRGMHDILPSEQPYWNYVKKKSRTILEDYGFSEIETPIIEMSALFIRTIGEATDIIEKEMYSFKTKGGDQLALRPEFTAAICRSYIEHGMHVLPQPIQLWSFGPVFRHDNPQAGRYRQFHQLNVEMFGDDTHAADAQLIFVAYKILESLGLKGLVVRVNSIGDSNCRPQYLKALKDFYRGKEKKLCTKCQVRLKTNILRVLDCENQECREVGKEVPQFVDYLDDECKKHFKNLIEFLDEIKIPYFLDHRLVRGLDYHTRTVFEIWPEDSVPAEQKEGGEQVEEHKDKRIRLALCSGGRYDKLVGILGGPKTSATGWAMGIERVISMMKEQKITPTESHSQPKVFIAQLGELAKRKSMPLFEEFRRAGISVRATFGRDSIKSQLKIAHRFGIKYTLILGQKEAFDGSVILREMDSGVQESIPMEKIVDAIKAKLKAKV